VVIGVYVALIIVASMFLRGNVGLYVGAVVGLSLLLVLICWLKGEKPRWRWGDKDDEGSSS
jgi:hypothetical protein